MASVHYPSSQASTSSAKEFDDELDFQSHVSDRLAETTSYKELVYTDVQCEWAANVIQLVNERFEGRSR